jgi:hypothetical protein
MNPDLEKILAQDDSHNEELQIPEWDVTVRLRSMTAKERGELEGRWAKRDAAKDPGSFRIDVLSLTLKTAEGEPLGTAEELRGLLDKNANVVERIFERSCELSGLSSNDVEVLEGN